MIVYTGIPRYTALCLALFRYSALASFCPPPPSAHGSTLPFFVYTSLLYVNRWPGGISRCMHSLTAQLVEWGG
jgi:hypothetical protein